MSNEIQPIELLVQEHRIIESALQGLLVLAMQAKQEPGPEVFDEVFAQQAIDFIREFADKHHHGKEEKYLFELMQERGLSRSAGPLAVMYHEHDMGRALVSKMEDSLRKQELNLFAQAAFDFAQLLSDHIQKEDRILYPMAQRFLTVQDMDELGQLFTKFESEAEQDGIQNTYYEVASHLEMLASGCKAQDESDCEGCCHCG